MENVLLKPLAKWLPKFPACLSVIFLKCLKNNLKSKYFKLHLFDLRPKRSNIYKLPLKN